MSASQEPDISDIHSSTVAETLSVSTTESVPHSIGGVSLSNVVPVSPVPVPQAPALSVAVSVPGSTDTVQHAAATIPAVGASISLSGDGTSANLGDRTSTALLNIASSSLNLTEILNAQQQALEQFQCQLQLAQQTEAINQRLDAIERTLNSLITQKAQEEAVKTQIQPQQQIPTQNGGSGGVPAAPTPQRSQGQQEATPLRPSQQLQFETPGSDFGGEDSKKKKLPRELCSKVRSTYHTLNLEFKIDERFLSSANQRVADSLIDTVYNESNGTYNVKDIKRAAHRYYESRRRLGIEELPDRVEKAAEQKKRRKYRARQQRSFDRRKKYVRESESRYWEHVTPACMTEESDSENTDRIITQIVTHKLCWRSEFLNQFIQKLDNRYERSRKPGTASTVKRDRLTGLPSTSPPPPSLPSWMIDPAYKIPATTAVCVSPPAMEGQEPSTVPEEVTTYTTLITEVPEVRDDSSDFELPDTVVA